MAVNVVAVRWTCYTTPSADFTVGLVRSCASAWLSGLYGGGCGAHVAVACNVSVSADVPLRTRGWTLAAAFTLPLLPAFWVYCLRLAATFLPSRAAFCLLPTCCSLSSLLKACVFEERTLQAAEKRRTCSGIRSVGVAAFCTLAWLGKAKATV